MPNNKKTPIPTGASGDKTRRSRFMVSTSDAPHIGPVVHAKSGTKEHAAALKALSERKKSNSEDYKKRIRDEKVKRMLKGKGTVQSSAAQTKKSGQNDKLTKVGDGTIDKQKANLKKETEARSKNATDMEKLNKVNRKKQEENIKKILAKKKI